MAFISTQNAKEDMQDDTFKLIAELILDCMRNYKDRDINELLSNIDVIYCTIHNRIKKEDKQQIEILLVNLKNKLYGYNDIPPESRGVYYSVLFDEVRGLYMIMTRVLDDLGILLKIKADLDNLVARSSL